jgi:hypothetical protein
MSMMFKKLALTGVRIAAADRATNAQTSEETLQ